MAFEPDEWADGAAGGTPITAAELNRIEAAGAAKAAQGERGPEGAEGPQGPAGAGGAGCADGAQGDEGGSAGGVADGLPSEAQWNELVARVEALETPEA